MRFDGKPRLEACLWQIGNRPAFFVGAGSRKISETLDRPSLCGDRHALFWARCEEWRMRRGGQRRFGFTTWIRHVAVCLLLLSIAGGAPSVASHAAAANSAAFDLATLQDLCTDRTGAGAPAGPTRDHRNCVACASCDRGQSPNSTTIPWGVVLFVAPAAAARCGLSDPRPAGPSRWARPWSSRAPPVRPRNA